MRLEIEGDSNSLSIDFQHEIYRSVQEMLANALKHSNAKQIEVRLNITVETLCISVRDDGIGFQASHDSEGIGILMLRDRAERMGGVFRIYPLSGGGTEAVIER